MSRNKWYSSAVVFLISVTFFFLLFTNKTYSLTSFFSNNRLDVSSDSACRDTIYLTSSFRDVFLLDSDIDMHGNIYVLPPNVTILQRNNACFKKGVLVGQGNKLKSKSPIFDRVSIGGTWRIKNISTSLFKDLNYVNSLRDVFALTNDDYYNVLEIGDGTDWVSTTPFSGALNIKSNTYVYFDCEIRLISNNYTGCYVMQIKDANNVKIMGGHFIGDREIHSGQEGEWGMGINLNNASNVLLRDVIIEKCWGDCIYVGTNSANVRIDNCILSKSRRQGISITDCNNITITNCSISDIGGTPPASGIDVETNKNCHIYNVKIKNCSINNCVCGIELNGYADNSEVSKVCISNCKIRKIKDSHSIVCYYTNIACIENCIVDRLIQYPVQLVECSNVKYKRIKRRF